MAHYGKRLPEDGREMRRICCRLWADEPLPSISRETGISIASLANAKRELGPATGTRAAKARSPHGTNARYDAGCRCHECREAKRVKNARFAKRSR